MVIVRLLLFTALAIVAVALALYFIKRDRRYLVFVGKVFKYTLFLLATVLLVFAAIRLTQEPAGRPAPTGQAPATSRGAVAAWHSDVDDHARPGSHGPTAA